MNYIWNRPLRSTLIDTLDSINHHEMGLVTDEGLRDALHALKAAVHPDSDVLLRRIKEGTATKNNAMIARFMGIQDTDIGWYDCEDVMPECVHIQEGGNTFENLLFHKEWNWLMPVVEQIEATLDADGYRYIVEISNTLCIIWSDGDCVTSQMRGHEGLTKIDAVYAAVVEFIKAEKA